ncbi:hypothetical protein AB0H96_41180, partial [Nonomuraea fuscirosea]
ISLVSGAEYVLAGAGSYPALLKLSVGAAGGGPAAHDIRWESLHGYTAVSGGALWTQAAERLRRANA